MKRKQIQNGFLVFYFNKSGYYTPTYIHNGRISLETEREMRKRKGARSEIEEEEGEAVQVQEHHNNGKIESEGCEGNGFFACYLLASLNPRFKGHTYIGYLSHQSYYRFSRSIFDDPL